MYFKNREGVISLISEVRDKFPQKDIWLYTGYTWEEINNLDLDVDVLVDGPFINYQKDISLLFRGSRNQRLIDVKKTRSQGKVIIYSK